MSRKLCCALGLLGLSALLWGCGGDSSTIATPDADSQIKLSAKSFSFEPSEIHLTLGQEVTFQLTARGAHHDFVLENTDFKVEADRGETAEAILAPLPEGTYTFYCSVSGHRNAGMQGTLIVDATTDSTK